MKKQYLIIFCICIGMSLSVNAQEKGSPSTNLLNRMTIGVKAGMNFAGMRYGNDNLSVYNQSIYPRGLFGIFTEYAFTKDFSIRPEFLFAGRGVKIDDLGSTYNIKSNYFDVRVPVLYTFHFFGKILPYVMVAPHVGFTAGGKIKLDSYKADVTKANMASTDFGLLLGIGTKFPVKLAEHYPMMIGVELGYNWGLSNTYSGEEKKSEAFAMNLGSREYKIKDIRANRGWELNASVSVPLSIFAKKKKVKPVPSVYVPPVEIKRDTIPYQDCYEIDEIIDYLDKGYDVRDRKICMYNLQFDFDKSDLKNDSKYFLDKVVVLLQRFPSMKMKVNGHTDNMGNAVYNEKLSTRRAEAVYHYLVDKGIKKERLSYQGFGMNKPIASNTTEEGRYKNRRVEFEILNTY